MTEKTTTKTLRDGTTIVTMSDGIQKRVYVYVGRDAEGDADGMIWTDRWTEFVYWKLDGGELQGEAMLRHAVTKDQLVTKFRNAIIAHSKAVA